MTIKRIYQLAADAPYNHEVKQQYRKAACAFLRRLAKEMHLAKGSYEIRFNAGGIAVEGDAILHHDRFYVNLSPGCTRAGYWRLCESRKDYVGKTNHFIREDETLEHLADAIVDAILLAK
jgi:hypothetical protein